MRRGVEGPADIQPDGLHQMIHGLLLLGWSAGSLLVNPPEIVVRPRVCRADGDGILEVLASFIKQIVVEGQRPVVSLERADQKTEIRRRNRQPVLAALLEVGLERSG